MLPGSTFQAFDSAGRQMCLGDCVIAANLTGANGVSTNAPGNGRESKLQIMTAVLGTILPFVAATFGLRALAAKNITVRTALARFLPDSCLPKITATEPVRNVDTGSAENQRSGNSKVKAGFCFSLYRNSSNSQVKSRAAKQRPIHFVDHNPATTVPGLSSIYEQSTSDEGVGRNLMDISKQQTRQGKDREASQLDLQDQLQLLSAPAPFWTAKVQNDTQYSLDSRLKLSAEIDHYHGSAGSVDISRLLQPLQGARAMNRTHVTGMNEELNSEILRRRQELFARARRNAHGGFGLSCVNNKQGSPFSSPAPKAASSELVLTSKVQNGAGDSQSYVFFHTKMDEIVAASEVSPVPEQASEVYRIPGLRRPHPQPVRTSTSGRKNSVAPVGFVSELLLSQPPRMRSLSPEVRTPLEDLLEQGGTHSRQRVRSSPLREILRRRSEAGSPSTYKDTPGTRHFSAGPAL